MKRDDNVQLNVQAPVIMEYDTVVVGAGVAGISAAVAAARNGMKTLLVERDGCVGGTATTGLMVVFMGVSFDTIKGNCETLLRRVEKNGGAFLGANTPFDPEIFKRESERWLIENGVNMLFHATFAQAIVEDGKITGIIVNVKEGFRTILCQTLIDATGDADVAASAGAEFQHATHTQPMTSIFRMDHVDTPVLMEYVRHNPDQFFNKRGQMTWVEDHDPPFFSIGGFFDIVKAGRESGELDLPHDSIWLGPLPRKGQYFINTTRVPDLDGTSSIDLSKAELEVRRQAWNVADFIVKHFPGFKDAYIIDIAVRVGVRETRRLLGQFVLTGDDLRSGASYEDTIATYDFPMDIHGAVGGEDTHAWGLIDGAYDIPYRVLVPRTVDNLLVSGRCISVDGEAHGSTRSMPCCMATGEAAGVAAAIAIKDGCTTATVDVRKLQKTLVEQGVNLR